MDCLEAINERRSVRKYTNKPVNTEDINFLLNAAQKAPSAGNMQGRDFIVVTSDNLRRELAKSTNQPFLNQSPVIIVAIANIERSSNKYGKRGELYAIQDTSASIMNLMLAATSIGMATCWIGAFDETSVKIICNIPYNDKIRPVALIPVGHPDESPAMPPRMNLDKIVHYDMW